MSNALINYHVDDGKPCGDTSLENIAQHYGGVLSRLRELVKEWEDTEHYDDLYYEATQRCVDDLRKAMGI